MKNKYEALDGKQFDTPHEALDHEKKLFEVWVNTPDLTVDVPSLLAVAGNEKEAVAGKVLRSHVMYALQKYFEENNAS